MFDRFFWSIGGEKYIYVMSFRCIKYNIRNVREPFIKELMDSLNLAIPWYVLFVFLFSLQRIKIRKRCANHWLKSVWTALIWRFPDITSFFLDFFFFGKMKIREMCANHWLKSSWTVLIWRFPTTFVCPQGIHMCDMTHSSVWHDSFICVTWLIYMGDMTHS